MIDRVARAVMMVALVCAIIGGLGTVGIMAIINADVVGRGLFSSPVPATAEIVSASIVAIVFLQLPYATMSGRNIRSDMLLNWLKTRSPRMEHILDAIHHLAGTVMLGILLAYVWPEVAASVENRETVGLYGVFVMPRWPFVLAILVGCALTFLAYALLTLSMGQRLLRNEVAS